MRHAAIRGRSLRPRLRAGARRRWVVAFELGVAAAICFVGYVFGAEWMQVHEARWVVGVLRLLGFDEMSGALPGHLLMFGPDGVVLNAEVTASCSSILSVTGLTALTVTAFRGRRQHAFAGLAAAIAFLLVLNGVRLAASALAGIWWGRPAMILFHDWVGSLWNFAATFAGFLVLVAVTLPARERAEQDTGGRHTARRPSSWARPGLGYQMSEDHPGAWRNGRGLTGLLHRYVLPRRLSTHLGARREAARIDYRIGHLPPSERAARVRELAADGLGAHTASLLAVANYDRDPEVLDTLAAEVAARQWEPVTSSRMMSLRLWARAWTMARGVPLARAAAATGPSPRADVVHATQSLADVVAALRRAGPGAPPRVGGALPATAPRAPRPGRAARSSRATPRSFARPRPTQQHATAEDAR
jgi:carbamoyl-phosphate synthase large subunit